MNAVLEGDVELSFNSCHTSEEESRNRTIMEDTFGSALVECSEEEGEEEEDEKEEEEKKEPPKKKSRNSETFTFGSMQWQLKENWENYIKWLVFLCYFEESSLSSNNVIFSEMSETLFKNR